MQLCEDCAEELAEKHSRNSFLKYLIPRIDAGSIYYNIMFGVGKNRKVIVERTPLNAEENLTCRAVKGPVERFASLRKLLKIDAFGASAKDGADGCARLIDR